MRSIVAVLLAVSVPSTAFAQVVAPSAPAAQPVVVAQPVYGQPVYPQPVYMQPGYAQPAYAQPMYVQPARVRPRRGGGALIGAGAGVLGAFWLITAFTGLIQTGIASDRSTGCPGTGGCSGLLSEGMINLIPVAGPFINAVEVGSSHNSWSPPVAMVYTLDGLVQTAGLVMLIAGGVVRSRSEVASRSQPHWAVLPIATPQSVGLSASFVTF